VSILDEAVERFRVVVRNNALEESLISIRMRPLSPEEAIGNPTRDDFPILKGKEVLVEADFKGSKGQAFTDQPSNFEGTLADVLTLDRATNRNRAVVVAAMNAVLRHLGIARNTVHCRDTEPQECAEEMARRFLRRWGEDLTIGLVGLQPAIASALISTFGADHVEIADLDAENIGRNFDGVIIKSGYEESTRVVANNFLALVSGSTIVNGTIDALIEESKKDNKNRIVIFYGTTIACIDALMGLRRLCFRSH